MDLADQILAGYQPQFASLAQHPTGRLDLSSGGLRDGLVQTVGGSAFVPETAVPVNEKRYQHLLQLYQKMRYDLIQPLGEW